MIEIRVNKKEKVLLLIMALAVFFWFYYLYMLKPLYKTIDTLTVENSRKAEYISRLDSIDISFERLKHAKAEYEGKLEVYYREIPRFFNISDVMVKTSSIVEARDLKELCFTPGEPIENQDYIELPINIKVNGCFPDIIGMIKDLENLSPIILVQELDISQAQEAQAVDARIKIVVVYTNNDQNQSYKKEKQTKINSFFGRENPFEP
jgi:Tfp pilus assembly protein PilO